MDAVIARTLRELLTHRTVASLATLHRDEPAVSIVPFVLPAGQSRLFIHVSALATHTRDMAEHPRVGLLVMDEPGTDRCWRRHDALQAGLQRCRRAGEQRLLHAHSLQLLLAARAVLATLRELDGQQRPVGGLFLSRGRSA